MTWPTGLWSFANMKKIAPAKTAWTAPKLVKLGTIADVAGPVGASVQASANNHS